MDASSILVIIAALFIAFRIWNQFGRKKASAEEVREVVAKGARLLDVRTPTEFSSGHLPDAINIPVQELSRRFAELGDKGAPIVVYCASGMRSAMAATMLRQAGFAQVHNLGAMSRY